MSDEHQVKKRKSSPELDASPAKKRKVNPDSDEDQVEGQIAPEFDEPPAKKLKLALESDVDQLKERNATSESNKDPPKEREVTPESDEGKPKEPKNTPGSGEFPAEKRTPSPVSVKDFDVSTPADKLLVRKHSEKARTPTRGSPLAAGYDLYRLDIGVLDCTVHSKLIRGSVQSRNASQLGGRLLSILRFRLRFLRAHMDASLHEVVLVSAT